MNERPMMAIPSTGSSGRRPIRIEEVLERKWTLDTKLDGVRSFGRFGRLINREGVDITHRYPEISLPADHWFDGEIVALDGRFETTLVRDQQSNPAKIKRLAEESPCRFVAFDLLDHTFEQQMPYAARRLMLEDVAAATGVTVTPIGDTYEFWEQIRDLKMEGVIAKRPTSPYRFGSRSRDWVKFKVLHRISAVAVGYLPGNGQRAHFGSMKLAVIGPDGPVELGRVGSGFTDKDTRELKRRLDAGELFVVEIECLNRTKDGSLRFPVYKGIRSDLSIHQCLIDQVEALPSC